MGAGNHTEEGFELKGLFLADSHGFFFWTTFFICKIGVGFCGAVSRRDMVVNLLLLLLLVLPFTCLALLSLVAFIGVAAIAGALHLNSTISRPLVSLRKGTHIP